jgi:outer membrane protein assembly factor BamB
LKRFRIVLFALAAILVLSGCSSVVTGESWANASTDGKFVYVAYKEQVFKIDPNSNAGQNTDKRTVTWLKKLPSNPHFYAAPTITEDGQLFVGSFDRHFYAFQAENGNLWQGWNVPAYTDKVVSPAAVNGDMVYVGVGDKGVYGYNRKTGEQVKFDGTKYGVWARPVVIGDTVYVASLDHYLYALDPKTLAKKWAIDLGGAIADSPSYDGSGTLFVGTWNSEVIAIDITGAEPKVANRFTTKSWAWGMPQYVDGSLYFGDLSGTLYALDAKTFKMRWQIAPEADAPGGIRGRVGIAKDVPLLKAVNGKVETETVPLMIVYGTEGKRAYAVDADGQRKWTSALTMSDKILSDVIIVGGSAVFTTNSEDQLVVALNLSSGQKDWQVRLADAQTVFQPTPQP